MFYEFQMKYCHSAGKPTIVTIWGQGQSEPEFDLQYGEIISQSETRMRNQ